MYILPALLSKYRMLASAPPDSGDKQIKNSFLSEKAHRSPLQEAGLGGGADHLLTFPSLGSSPAPSNKGL